MKKALKIIGSILLVLLAVLATAWFGFLKPKPPPISAEDREAIHLMPLPAELKLGSETFVLNEKLTHEFTGQSNPRLERAAERFYQKLSTFTNMNFGEGESVQLILNCTNGEESYPSIDDDESYSIHVLGSKIIVQAPEEKGILYALESLLQLVENQDGKWVIPRLSLKDNPRYPWRGLMIDACRHWIPKDAILRNLEAMGTVKMNVFHWHLTEYQAFRIESKVFPKLHTLGSGGHYYTQEDVKEVIEFAADRGIRVIPEFDLPGHSTSWLVGYPELGSAPGPYELDTTFGLMPGVIDPTREEVYTFLESFLEEMTVLFPDRYMHIGGDEVLALHWEENEAIQDYMKAHGLDDSHALQVHFNIRLQKILAGLDITMMGWDEIIHPDLPSEGIVVQTWSNHSSLWEAARSGNKAILSAGYYLDYKYPASKHYQVDPAIIPGAVDIEVDSALWKSWDLVLTINDMVLEGGLYLFGEGDELRGIMDFMGGTQGFTEAEDIGEQLTFSMKTNFGTMDYKLALEGDSLSGEASLSMFRLGVTGTRSGGSDIEDGSPMPEFKRIVPLTPVEESRLIGGEACMWTEMADGTTLESRIWPRAAAIAEKLWSPQNLSGDVKDMYRRLLSMDDRLVGLELRHKSYAMPMIAAMVEEPYREALWVLSTVLHEDQLFNRMAIYKPELYTTTPLDRMVDAAAPESSVVIRFGRDVDQWIESDDIQSKDRLVSMLEIWEGNHKKLAPAFESSEQAGEVRIHSAHLAALSSLGLAAIEDPASLESREEELAELFIMAAEANGGTILAITQDVQKLVESATKN